MREWRPTGQTTWVQPAWSKLTATQKQALTVMADKIARILSGDPDYADNWHDIQGYAKLVEDRLGVERRTPSPDARRNNNIVSQATRP